jgi:hypothetical protein
MNVRWTLSALLPRSMRSRRVPTAPWWAACLVAAICVAGASSSARESAATMTEPAVRVAQSQLPAEDGTDPPVTAPAPEPRKKQPGPGEKGKAPPVAPPSSWLDRLKFAGWIAFAAAIAFGVGFVVGRATAPPGTDRRKPPEQPPGRLPELTVAATPGAQESFQYHYRDLRDLYGDVWRAAEGDGEQEDERSKSLARWRERLEQLKASRGAGLIGAWSRLESHKGATTTRAKAKLWLEALEAWGLVRMHPREIEVNERTLRQFHVFPADAARAVVTEPCWLYGGVVLQKGQATGATARS